MKKLNELFINMENWLKKYSNKLNVELWKHFGKLIEWHYNLTFNCLSSAEILLVRIQRKEYVVEMKFKQKKNNSVGTE